MKIKYLKTGLTVVVLIFFALFVYHTDKEQTLLALRSIGPRFGWFMVSTCLAYTLATIGWRYCFAKHSARVPLSHLFMIRHVGETVAIFNPTSVVGGEMSKVFFLKPYHIDKQEAVQSVVLARIIMISSQLTLLIASMTWLIYTRPDGFGPTSKYLLLSIPALLLFLFISFTYFSARSKAYRYSLPENSSRWKKSWHRILDTLADLSAYCKDHTSSFLLAFFFFTLHWLVGSLELYLILHFLGHDSTLIDSLLMDMGVIFIKSTAAFIPGQLGIEELGNKLMLGLLGTGASALWLAVSVLRRFRQICWTGLALVFYFVLKGKNGMAIS